MDTISGHISVVGAGAAHPSQGFEPQASALFLDEPHFGDQSTSNGRGKRTGKSQSCGRLVRAEHLSFPKGGSKKTHPRVILLHGTVYRRIRNVGSMAFR